MTEDIEIKTVIKIDPECKYVLIMAGNPNESEFNRVAKRIREWWQSDEKFIVVSNMRLEKVGEPAGT